MSYSHELLFVAMLSAVLHLSSAMDCKEVWERKHETADCCSAPAILNLDNLKSNIEGQEGNKHEKFFCGVHNLMKEQNLVDDEGNLDVDAMKQNTEGFDDEWKQIAQQAIDHCVQKTESMMADMEQRGGPKGQCQPTAGMFLMCLGKASIKNCPADKWNSSELCEKVKSGECDKRGHKH